jgi:hypothetical protein
MPTKRDEERKPEAPRTDLPPERERDGAESAGEEREDPARSAAEDAAGGDREIW